MTIQISWPVKKWWRGSRELVGPDAGSMNGYLILPHEVQCTWHSFFGVGPPFRKRMVSFRTYPLGRSIACVVIVEVSGIAIQVVGQYDEGGGFVHLVIVVCDFEVG